MKDNMMYGIVAIVAVLVFVGAAILVSSLSSPTYSVNLSLAANNSAVARIYPYQSTVFNIIVSNNGSKEIVGLPVAFYVNGAQRNYSTYTIPAHQSIEITIPYTYLASGVYLFTASADPGNVIKISNRSGASKSITFAASNPQAADVYVSVPNSNIIYTDSFTTSGTGIYSGSIMGGIYNVSAVSSINGPSAGGILPKVYEDLYQYISVTNGAYSTYSNGTSSYVAWIQGTVYPQYVAAIVSSFGKTVSNKGTTEFSALSNTVSLCAYYQGGWTKLVELYNNSDGATCVGIASMNYTPTEASMISNALKGTKLGNLTTSNSVTSGNQISWQHFYYNNATVLGRTVEYANNTVAASTLSQLSNPTSIFITQIRQMPTNVLAVNTICEGITTEVNGTSACSVLLSTKGLIGNQSYGAVYTKFISRNYTIGVYSLIDAAYFTLAHANAVELISKLGVNQSQVVWRSPFNNSCSMAGGLSCKLNQVNANGSINMTLTNLNFSSIQLENFTCEEAGGFKPSPLNGTLLMGGSTTFSQFCHYIPEPGFVQVSTFLLNVGFKYRGTPMVANGILNITSSS